MSAGLLIHVSEGIAVHWAYVCLLEHNADVYNCTDMLCQASCVVIVPCAEQALACCNIWAASLTHE